MTYKQAIKKSLEFIELNMKNDIKTIDIAIESGYSLYHFHRLFLAVIGTTVADYIRRRRLTLSAISLLETEKEIIQIAFDHGFASQESFTRAFKKLFDTTPAGFRRSKIPQIARYQLKIDLLDNDKIEGDIDMEHKIIETEGFKVIGLSKNYVFKQPNDIPELWMEFSRREDEIQNAIWNGKYYGVCIQANKESDNFEYMACVEVKNFDDIPSGMTEHTIAHEKYAVFTVKEVQNLQPTFEQIYGVWINETEYEIENSPDFELYDERFDPENPTEGEIDIYIPIKAN